MSFPVLFVPEETNFDSYGLGTLREAIKCTVVQKLNGEYEMTMVYPVSGRLFDQIQQRSIIKASVNRTDDPQPFRVYRISKPINGKVTVYARHLAYDLAGITVSPFTASDIRGALAGIKSHSMTANPFTFVSTRTTAARFAVLVPTSAWGLMGGQVGSLLDVYGGEYAFDGYTVRLESRVGADNGVSVRYGVNMTDFEQDANCSSCYTGVVPYWTKENTVIYAPVVEASGDYGYTRTLAVDMSDKWEEQPTVSALTAAARKYITDNDIGTPRVSWKVAFVPLDMTEEYKHVAALERVALGDTVRVKFDRLGVDAAARVNEVEWDALTNRYVSVSLGSVRNTIADTMAKQARELENVPDKAEVTSLAQRVAGALTKSILGANGGSVRLLDTDGDGEPDTLYIADNPDPNQAVKVWRFNYAGWGASKNGYNGPFTMGATLSDGLLAEFVTAAHLTAGTIQSADGQTFYLNLDTGELRLNNYAKTSDVPTKVSQLTNDSGYQTASQVTTAISVESGRIQSAVTEQINNIYIGGRNLLLNSSMQENLQEWDNNGGEIVTVSSGTTFVRLTGAEGETKNIKQSVFDRVGNDQPGTEYTLSGDFSLSAYSAGTTNPLAAAIVNTSYVDSDDQQHTVSNTFRLDSISNKGRKHLSFTFSSPPDYALTNMVAYLYLRDATGRLYAKHLKLERGNKASDWSPAPEDYPTYAEMSTQITQTAQSIRQEASATYVTNNTYTSGINTVTNKANAADAKAGEAKDLAQGIGNNLSANYYTKTQTTAAIELTASEIRQTVNEKVEQIYPGGKNLLLNSSMQLEGGAEANFDGWENNGATMYTSTSGVIRGRIIGNKTETKSLKQEVTNRIKNDPAGTEYTISGDFILNNYSAGENPNVSVVVNGYYDNDGTEDSATKTITRGNTSIVGVSSTWERKSYSFSFEQKLTRMVVLVYMRNASGTLYFKNLKLEVGNTATSWSPAPEEYATQEQWSEIVQTAESIRTEVGKKANQTDMVSRFNQTASDLQAEVTRATQAEGTLSSRITATATEINTEVAKKVGASEIISKINQTAETIKISASKLNLSGYVTVTNLATPGAVTIDGSNLTIAGGSNLYPYYDSFEQVTDSTLSSVKGSNLTALVLSSQYAREGSKLLHLSTGDSTSSTYIFLGTKDTNWGQPKLVAGHYIASCYIGNTTGTCTGKFGVYGRKTRGGSWSDSSTYSALGSKTFSVSGGYTRFEIPFDVTSTYPFVAIRFEITTANNGVLIDCIQIESAKEGQSAGHWHPASVTQINGGNILANSITATQIDATNLHVSAANIDGTLVIGQLPTTVAKKTDIPTKVSALTNDSGYQTSTQVTTITNDTIKTTNVTAANLKVKAANIDGTLTASQIVVGDLTDLSSGVSGWTLGDISISKTVANSYRVRLIAPASPTSGQPAIDVQDWNNSAWREMFYVTYGGKMYARNAEIAGTITATSGTIGGWTITSGGISNSGDNTYRARMLAPSSPTSSNTAFSVQAYQDGAWQNMFYVAYSGKMLAKNADIEGKVTATSGTIGGITLSNGKLTIDNAHLGSGAVGNSNLQSLCIGNGNLQSSCVSNAKLQSGCVGNSNLQGDSVGYYELQDDSIGNVHLQTDSVANAQIQSGSIRTSTCDEDVQNALADAIYAGKVFAGLVTCDYLYTKNISIGTADGKTTKINGKNCAEWSVKTTSGATVKMIGYSSS